MSAFRSSRLRLRTALMKFSSYSRLNRGRGKSTITAVKSAILAVTTIISGPIEVFRKESS
jgi:hypothetical protein